MSVSQVVLGEVALNTRLTWLVKVGASGSVTVVRGV